MLCSALVGATTAEAWTTMPKSATYHHSPRSAISARASTTWLPTAQSKHSSPHRGLRENHPPQKETRRSTVTWRYPTWALNKKKLGPGKHRGQSNCFDGEMGHRAPPIHWSCFWNYLRFKKKCSWRIVFLSFGVTLRNTAVLLHSGGFRIVWLTAVLCRVSDCSK